MADTDPTPTTFEGRVAFAIANQILQHDGEPSLALVVDALHLEVDSFDRSKETVGDFYRRRLVEFFEKAFAERDA